MDYQHISCLDYFQMTYCEDDVREEIAVEYR